MKCQECGHDYPSTITRCTRCGEINPRRKQTHSSSRLIEFPRKARAEVEPAPKEPPLPEWRVEVRERVRAIRAKRNAEEADAAAIGEVPSPKPRNHRAETRVSSSSLSQEIDSAISGTSPYGEEIQTGRDRSFSASTRIAAPETARAESRPNNHIADAALARVRRASEKARLARLPKIDAPRSEPTAKRAITADNQATARALEPAVEIKLSPAPEIEPSPEQSPEVSARSISVKAARRDLPKVEPQPVVFTHDSFSTSDTQADNSIFPSAFEEIEPHDYLEAEVRKFDGYQVTGQTEVAEFPGLSVHFAISFIDLVVIATGSTPFLALIEILNGDFANSGTWISSVMIVLLVTFFYMTVTQSLCGKTFGMMLTNTQIVSAKTHEPPTIARSLLRAAGYFLAIPLLIGLLWPITNRRRRGLQDIISGTLVTHDF